MIGFSDLIANREHATSVKCISCHGSVFEIKADDFRYKMSREQSTWNYLLQNAKEKDLEAYVHIKNVSHNIGVFQNNKPDKKAKSFRSRDKAV